MNVKERAKTLADLDAMIHCCSWPEIQKTIRDILAEVERLERENANIKDGTWVEDVAARASCEARYQAEQEMITITTTLLSAAACRNTIRKHFGLEKEKTK